ncbi:MAG: TRAP transporter fused permease subunit [Alphaproteobacteria bacterium]|nr:MAG: TRAP transporter fused permease subunit [Alphaproteobacteria bacterium]
MLFTIVAAFLLYALVADRVPGALIGKALNPVRLVQHVGFDPGAVFASPLAVGTMVVLLFVFFGQLLFAAGGGAFFTDLAMAATGRTRGGSAKIAVVGSALFGAISGSAVSNVATTGVITIPLMQRGGYSPRDAGAIEAVASTGGQLAPPIMGAAAFLMAEFLEIPYAAIAAAALIPALIYYYGLFLQVDLIAGRDRIAAVPDDSLTVRRVLAEGWHFVLPLGLLLWALFWWGRDPEDAALLAGLAVVAVGFLRGYRGVRLTPAALLDAFVETGRSMVDLILVVAAAGFVIGVLNITGLGFALTLVLVDAAGGQVLVLMIMAALVSIVLGMGMPTSGVYVLLAALVAPALVQAGIEQVAAHLFILYFGMMLMITPPVALAAFAAATISRDDPLKTGLAAMRFGWTAFILPFVFVATPGLLGDGGWQAVAVNTGLTVVSITAVTVAIVGYWGRRLGLAWRALAMIAGLAGLPLGFLPGGALWHFAGALAAIALGIGAWLTRRRGGDAIEGGTQP